MANTLLERLQKRLEQQIPKGRLNYVVPDLWNAWDYDGEELRRMKDGNLLVNPYRFYSSVIKNRILPNRQKDKDYSLSLSRMNGTVSAFGGDWVRKSVMYSTMIRASAAWDHDRSNSLDLTNFDDLKETGTFVKMLALLPLFQKMGVDVVYMLPISRFSLKDKKGELGSPYGVASFFDLDPNLKDDLTGDKFTVEDEFKAFVEACHLLSMRVVIDIIPRTNAVENDLIKDHPDWFYWIKASQFKNYKVPYVDGLENTLSPDPKYMPEVYASKDVQRHIGMFQFDPKTQDAAKWEALVASHPADLTDAIEKAFDLKIAPAFSDHINDVQPPWTDVTFFRMYLDHPKANQPYLKNKKTPPYILFDSIKCNLFPGDVSNTGLWETLANIIPHYQKNYGIDGARIDMGHALPKDLLTMIIQNAKKVDPDFAFIAEELNPDNAKKAKELGYNIIIGNGFWMEPRIWEKRFHKFVYGAKDVALPMFACAETHDTARIAGRDGGKTLAKMVMALNMFLPNLVPFINSGQEVFEVQPMNTGVDCTDKDRYNLPADDPFYGKLALFDRYAFHYTAPDRWEFADHMTGIAKIRARWVDDLTDLEHHVPLYVNEFDTEVVGFGYFNPASKKMLLVFANANYHHGVNVNASLVKLREKAKNVSREGRLVYSTHEWPRDFREFHADGGVYLWLQPGEVKVIEL